MQMKAGGLQRVCFSTWFFFRVWSQWQQTKVTINFSRVLKNNSEQQVQIGRCRQFRDNQGQRGERGRGEEASRRGGEWERLRWDSSRHKTLVWTQIALSISSNLWGIIISSNLNTLPWICSIKLWFNRLILFTEVISSSIFFTSKLSWISLISSIKPRSSLRYPSSACILEILAS